MLNANVPSGSVKNKIGFFQNNTGENDSTKIKEKELRDRMSGELGQISPGRVAELVTKLDKIAGERLKKLRQQLKLYVESQIILERKIQQNREINRRNRTLGSEKDVLLARKKVIGEEINVLNGELSQWKQAQQLLVTIAKNCKHNIMDNPVYQAILGNDCTAISSMDHSSLTEKQFFGLFPLEVAEFLHGMHSQITTLIKQKISGSQPHTASPNNQPRVNSAEYMQQLRTLLWDQKIVDTALINAFTQLLENGIHHGFEINTVDENGANLLHHIVMSDRHLVALVETVIHHGIDTQHQDALKQSPLECAELICEFNASEQLDAVIEKIKNCHARGFARH